jgi:hypothetical protein
MATPLYFSSLATALHHALEGSSREKVGILWNYSWVMASEQES